MKRGSLAQEKRIDVQELYTKRQRDRNQDFFQAGKFTMQNFGTTFHKRNQSLQCVESKQSFGQRASKVRLQPHGGSKRRSPSKIIPSLRTDSEQLSRDVQAAKNALNFKTPRNSMLANRQGLPTLTTVERVHVYNSSSLQSPMHLNNIMISVKRKLEEHPAPSKKSQSRLIQHKIAAVGLQQHDLGQLTSLNITTSHNMGQFDSFQSPMTITQPSPSLTQRQFQKPANFDILPSVKNPMPSNLNMGQRRVTNGTADLPYEPSSGYNTLEPEVLNKRMINPAALDTFAILSNQKGFIQFPDQAQNELLQTQSSFGKEMKQLRNISPTKLKVQSITKFKPVVEKQSRNHDLQGKNTSKLSKNFQNSTFKEPKSPRFPTTLRKQPSSPTTKHSETSPGGFMPIGFKPSRPSILQRNAAMEDQVAHDQSTIMVKGNSGLLQLHQQVRRTGGIKQIEQNAYSNRQNSPLYNGIKLDPEYRAQETKLQDQDKDGPDEKGTSQIDYRRIKLLQVSSEEESNDQDELKRSSISHDEEEHSDEPTSPVQLTHKLKAQKKADFATKPKQRKSILREDTIGSNSELNKTMSHLGNTFNFSKDFVEQLEAQRVPYQKMNLPSIAMRTTEQAGTYMIRTHQRSKQRFQKQAGSTSKTTLNIMNVTFNSRPGVKQYIQHVVGRRAKESQSQLPKQGQRANKHNGYSNFYFSSQKRGTVQRFNLLDAEMKTKVQQNLLKEAEQNQKILNKKSKALLEQLALSTSRINQDFSMLSVDRSNSKISKKYAVNTTFYSPLSASQMTGVPRQPQQSKQRLSPSEQQLPITQNMTQIQNESRVSIGGANLEIQGVEALMEPRKDIVVPELDDIQHTQTLEKKGTIKIDGAKRLSTYTVHHLNEKSETEDSFNRSDDGADSQMEDATQMKITTSKLAPRITAPHGFGVTQSKIITKKQKQFKNMAMHQTYGGMQPWHEMQKQKVKSLESDDGIFQRHNNNISEMNSSKFSNFGHPAVLDGRIFLLDAQEAVQSMNDNESSIKGSLKQSSQKTSQKAIKVIKKQN